MRDDSTTKDDRLSVVVERIDPAKNAYRYYVMSVQPNLFGEQSLVREWGRIGTRGGQHAVELHHDTGSAQVSLETWLRRKQRKGYA